MALSWSSVGMGCAGGNDSYWGCGSITVDRDGVVADVSGDGRAGGNDSYWGCGSITVDRDGVVAVVSGDGRAGGDDSCRV